MYIPHKSIMVKECLDFLTENQGTNFADLTFGAGGHGKFILENPNHFLTGVDRDPLAISLGEQMNHPRLKMLHTNYCDFPKLYQGPPLDGLLLDLGVSTHQLMSGERGMSIKADGPLDMRMNPMEETPTAADIVNHSSFEELVLIFQNYGEEPFSKRIATHIIEQRPLKYTSDLEQIVFHCYPKRMRHQKTHPATKVFQALRIKVNEELEALQNSLHSLYDLLAPRGRMVVMSFHSLEDRIVKHEFKKLVPMGAKILTKRPLTPTEEEKDLNPRSRSTKMRVIEKGD